jgi:hypothetical protein
MESVIGPFKTEAIAPTVFHDGPDKTLADVEYAVAGWVDWHNQATPARLARNNPGRARAAPLPCPQPRAATHMRAAENP